MGQNWLAGQVTKRLSKDLQTHISIKHVSISFVNFNKMNLEGVLVEDQKRDTLLYAGKFQVRITDWFFFKNKADLKYVSLEDATIHFNRTDSIWNYQFLEKYFSSASTDTSAKKNSGIAFDLKKVVMKNVTFIKKDAWLGNNLVAKVGGLAMDANKITIADKTIDVANLQLTDPYVSIFDYTGNYVASTDTVKIKPVIHQTSPNWKISFGNININNGQFKTDKQTLVATLPYFDGEHIYFSKINGSLKNIGWTADTVRGNINLTAKERSGLVIKSLKAQTTIYPQAMIFDHLYLQTNRSILNNYFSLRYPSIDSMSNFLHKVTLEADFEKATISSDDIAFFAPQLRTWKKIIKLDGNIKGTVDALASKDLEIWAGNNTYVHGAVSIVGLPNINETLINIDAQDLRTTYADAVSFIPGIRNIITPNLKQLNYLRFKGTYTGFVNDFVTYGTLQTNLGTLQTDLNMKFKGEPVYSGKISTEGFQIGKFINSPSLGLVDFHGTVKGKGFNWQTLNMSIDGVSRKLQYGNYVYQNITAKGSLTKKLFNGDFVIKDPNADMHLRGIIDLTGAKPLFNATADIAHANLKALQLTQNDLQLSGKFDLNLQASSLSDLIGTARISNAKLINGNKQLSFDSLAVTSDYTNGLKTMHVVSNEFNGTVTGDFDLQTLPNAFTLFLSRYYPSYIKAPKFVKPQTFTFDITTGVVDDYIKLIDNRLSGFNNSHFTGSLNTSSNTMTVDANIPYFQFRQYNFSDVQLKGSGDLQKLVLTGQVTNAQIGDSLLFPQTNFSIQAQNDVSDIVVNTTANQAINQANISAQIKTFSDGATIVFNPSTFSLNGKTWTIEQGGQLNFRKNTVVQGQVILKESNQQIKLWTEPDPEGNWNNLHVALKNLNLGDISPLLTNQSRFEGLLSGEIIVEDPENRFNIRSSLHTDELRIDNDSIGQTNSAIIYNNKTGMLTAQASNADLLHHIDLDLAMNLKDSTHSFTNRITIKPTNFQLNYLNNFLGDIFSNIQGYATGRLDILGSGKNQQFIGKVKITDASLKVNFTQVTYKIDNTEIELKKDTIDLNNIRLRDRYGNTALVKGYIRHNAFQNMYYDISVETQSRQMELINTTYNDNQQFFGRAMGSGSFVLVGPQSNLLMNIDARASQTDSSYITLPPSRNRETGQANFLVERKYGKEMTPQELHGNATNITYNVNITANPLVNIEVILDDLTEDRIKGRGTGNLLITSGTSEPLSIQGRYDIDEGDYLFTFQSFLKKPFVLKKGSKNYIEWNGDPYGATVHLEAVYTAEKVSFAPLAGTLIATTNQLDLNRVRDDVNVIATLTGNLFHPTFSFKLAFPGSNLINNPAFAFGLQQIEKNPNELNKQVTYLIVFNSFAPFENLTSTAFNPFEEFTYNTISALFFGEVNKRFNQLLSKLLHNNNVTLNFTGSLYNRRLVDQTTRGGFKINQGDVNLSLGLPLFNDRAHITFGGTLNVPLDATLQQTIRLLPDVTVELLLNQSGSLRATFFYRQNVDFLIGNTNTGIIPRRYGTSLSYAREFDNLGELLNRKKSTNKKKTNKDTLQKNPAVSTSGN